MTEIWLLVFWLGTTHGGATTEQFATEELCYAAKEVLAENLLPDRNADPKSWTANLNHVHAYKRSTCLQIQ
ncbi:hypothetical protein KA005_04590 [bacterium]|nr:hypothetical protein [bacterium]